MTTDSVRCPPDPGSQASPGVPDGSPPSVSIPIATNDKMIAHARLALDCFREFRDYGYETGAGEDRRFKRLTREERAREAEWLYLWCLLQAAKMAERDDAIYVAEKEALVRERANSEGLRKALELVQDEIDDPERQSYVAEINPRDGSWIRSKKPHAVWLSQPAKAAVQAALSASPSPTLPNTRMGEDA